MFFYNNVFLSLRLRTFPSATFICPLYDIDKEYVEKWEKLRKDLLSKCQRHVKFRPIVTSTTQLKQEMCKDLRTTP